MLRLEYVSLPGEELFDVLVKNVNSLEEVFSCYMTQFLECEIEDANKDKETIYVRKDSINYVIPSNETCKVYKFPTGEKVEAAAEKPAKEPEDLPSVEEEDAFFKMLEDKFNIKNIRREKKDFLELDKCDLTDMIYKLNKLL